MNEMQNGNLQANVSKAYADEVKGKSGIKRIVNAAGHSIDGFVAAYKNEPAFRQICVINGALILVLCFVSFTLIIKMVLLFSSVFSLVVELFNTGIEAAIDHTSTEKHPLAKVAKDVSSAAQFLALLLLGVLWMMAIFSLC